MAPLTATAGTPDLGVFFNRRSAPSELNRFAGAWLQFSTLQLTSSFVCITASIAMADIFAIPAGVVALIQAVELVLGALGALNGCKNATVELLTVGDEIRHLHGLVCNIEGFIQSGKQPFYRSVRLRISAYR
jgi:hypothetical protein